MKFKPTGTTGHGSTYCEENFVNRSWYNEQALLYRKLFIPKISKWGNDKSDMQTDLEIEWKFLISKGPIPRSSASSIKKVHQYLAGSAAR